MLVALVSDARDGIVVAEDEGRSVGNAGSGDGATEGVGLETVIVLSCEMESSARLWLDGSKVVGYQMISPVAVTTRP